jgi:hypothetical protein
MTPDRAAPPASRVAGLAPALVAAAIAALAVALRWYGIGDKSVWLDEAYSHWFASQDWRVLWTEVPVYETHPVLYYSLLKLWMGLGESEAAMRSLSMAMNLVTLPLVAGLGWLLAPEGARGRTAALAALLFALSETQLRIAQDARPYAMMTLAMALSLLCAVFVMLNPGRACRPLARMARDDRAMFVALSGLAAGLALLGWSHHLGGLSALAVGGGLLTWWLRGGRDGRLFANLLLVAGLSAVLWLPSGLMLLAQMRALDGNGMWIPAPSKSMILGTLLALPLGLTAPLALVLAPAAILGLGALWASLAPRLGTRTAGAVALTLILAALGTWLVTAVVSHAWIPVFLRRTLECAQVPLIVGLALLPALVARRVGDRLASAVAALLVVAAAMAASGHVQRPQEPSEDYRQASDRILATAGGGVPVVVVAPTSSSLPFLYYEAQRGRDMAIVPVPGPYPVVHPDHSYPAGGGGVPAITADMIPPLEARLRGVQEIWAFQRGHGLFDPDGVVAAHLDTAFPCVVERVAPGAERRRRAGAEGC